MNWLSFFIGVLVGWIVEWLIDLFYWRRKWLAAQQENEDLRTRLNVAQVRIRALEAKSGGLEIEQPTVPVANVALGGATMAPPAATVVVPPVAAAVDVDLQTPAAGEPEPSLESVIKGLKARFPHIDLDGAIARLKARFPDLNLKTAIDGLKIDFPDLDIGGAFDDIKARFAGLGAGAAGLAERSGGLHIPAGDQADDLKILEGIGPKIARILNDQGILTFAQLAAASQDRLGKILRDAGPQFQLADPASWPEQARLAADGAWDQLKVLQDELTAGRERPLPRG